MSDIPDNDTLLIYAPVPLHRDAAGNLFVEAQAVNGLRLWAANFARVIVMMPLSPEPVPAGWVPVSDTGGKLDRVRFEMLPMAYRPDQFLRHLPATRRHIRRLIAEAQWLSFAIGGLFGDWGAVAGFAAHDMGRPFAVWTDRVESEVVRKSSASGPWKERLRARLTHRPMAWLERAVIRRASLGLFHGRETYETYAPFATGPAEVVHDIHIAPGDHIAADRLAAKVAQAGEGPLRLVYTGRADPMKGPLDWIEVLERLAAMGVDFRARWLGDGSERPAMLARIAAAGLEARVEMPGFVTDRTAILEELRGAHAFLFCHLTPESPRCLIEALASGCPIVGYGSTYPADLISVHGAGVLVPMGDRAALAGELARLDADRPRLSDLIVKASRDGAPFTDEHVFEHRSEVIRRHLGPANARAGLAAKQPRQGTPAISGV
ncbi:group 1 glycosyl transferase [Sphingomonas sp. LH128]|uniref:glycosyltransferase n=1 Tax=Sphingomonas sp. LH128 TaxID=473781 RepID=UPI00027CB8EF|nr:glycosyltransferase [Sphingomonas sp. LH128]EJU12040.1 group 1 glycosyl transferase [Sphingomonas sp. LH128]